MQPGPSSSPSNPGHPHDLIYEPIKGIAIGKLVLFDPKSGPCACSPTIPRFGPGLCRCDMEGLTALSSNDDMPKQPEIRCAMSS